VGIAWEAGVLAGLAEAGADLAAAVDHVIGTSAGAFIGARVALGHTPGDIAAVYAREPRAVEEELPTSAPPSAPAEVPDLAFLFQMIQEAARAGRSAAEIARDLGAFALQAKTMAEDEFIARFTSKLRPGGVGAWPARSFVCTAFDAQDGSFKIWDGAAGVDLACAVASSCAVPGIYPAVTIGKRRYIDGGVLSTTNAHLARGYDVIFVLTVTEVLVRQADVASEKKTPLQREMQALRETGAEVHVIALDSDALRVVGTNLMAPAQQRPALREGIRQGRVEAARLAPALAK
jgi:NTE family protein